MSGRSTPQLSRARGDSNPTHSRQGSSSIRRSNDTALASLRATQVVISKPVLPAELIALILDYLPVPDLLRCARVSRKLKEMVYDDTRWTQKLKAIGVWNESEARQHVEDAMKRKVEAQRAREADEARRTGARIPGSVNGIAGGGAQRAGNVTLFDAGLEERKERKSLEHMQVISPTTRRTLTEGFDDLTLSPTSHPSTSSWNPALALTVLSQVKSVRGRAKHEFSRIYGALAPLYLNLARSKKHSEAIVFKTYRDPEHQAQVLSSIKRFAKCDSSLGWQDREQKLDTVIGVFENAVLREFEQACAANDVDGRMRRYAHVLVTLNSGNAAIDLFISHHPLMSRRLVVGMPLDCLEAVAPGHVDLSPAQNFFENLANKMIEQAAIIDRVFPESVDVLTPFASRLCEDIINEYLTTLFGEARHKGVESYVKAVGGTFEQAMRFVASLRLTKASPADFLERVKRMIMSFYEKRMDRYLSDELSLFTSKSDSEVTHWEKEFSEQEASKESFFMSNLNRQAAKRDFLSSFKKVVMMPVNVIPAFNATAKPAPKPAIKVDATTGTAIRSSSPTPSGTTTPQRPSTPQPEPPATELAAKAAIMNSRLEGIKSLFSIEVALNLTHMAKAAIERMALMARMEGHYGAEAKVQCNAVFMTMLNVLGDRHVKHGFDKAVSHLSNYNPREVREMRAKAGDDEETNRSRNVGVEPLVTFLELVNVGDLIQQMIDVFFSQELVSTKLTDSDDFLNPAVKEKKRFEQMLDERVAAGLNRGIDVLMDEIEYICATTQIATDFNPGATSDGNGFGSGIVDIGPSRTAKEIVDMVSGHTNMLIGSTDKNMLDVFTQEVGLRLFAVLCKHFKRQRISVDGAIKFISDINHYSGFINSLRQKPLQPYFQALREMAQIYLVQIDPPAALFGSTGKAKRGSILSSKGSRTAAQAKELATIIADVDRYRGIFPSEEVYTFAERRADWYLVKNDVERALYGAGCSLM